MSLRSASVRVVPDMRSVSLVLGVHRGDIERHRLLRCMLVFGAGIDIEMLHLAALQRSARDHALHRLLQHALGMLALHPLPNGAPFYPARIAGVIIEHRLVRLLPGHPQLGSIHHHDVVATINVRRELRLVLAAQTVGDDRGKAAEYDALGVDQHPVLLHLRRLQRECALHAGGSAIWRRHMAGNTHRVKVFALWYHFTTSISTPSRMSIICTISASLTVSAGMNRSVSGRGAFSSRPRCIASAATSGAISRLRSSACNRPLPRTSPQPWRMDSACRCRVRS